MKIEWLYEARAEFRDILTYYKTSVGGKYAAAFARRILDSVAELELFPEMGVLRKDTLMGEYGFRALFIDKHVCIYKIEGDTVFVYHLADARHNYIYRIFGIE